LLGLAKVTGHRTGELRTVVSSPPSSLKPLVSPASAAVHSWRAADDPDGLAALVRVAVARAAPATSQRWTTEPAWRAAWAVRSSCGA